MLDQEERNNTKYINPNKNSSLIPPHSPNLKSVGLAIVTGNKLKEYVLEE